MFDIGNIDLKLAISLCSNSVAVKNNTNKKFWVSINTGVLYKKEN